MCEHVGKKADSIIFGRDLWQTKKGNVGCVLPGRPREIDLLKDCIGEDTPSEKPSSPKSDNSVLPRYKDVPLAEQVQALLTAKRESWQVTVERLNCSGYVIVKQREATHVQRKEKIAR